MQKLEEKVTRGLENDMRNLANFHWLKNSDFILESEIAELNKNKIQNNQIDQMQCENFILSSK